MDSTVPLTFGNYDRLGLQEFCSDLERFLAVERDFVEGSLVVALSGGFGSGKTTFIKMWETSLLERREQGQFLPMPVILNAWESDHCGDPLLAILAGLMEVIDKWTGTDAPKDKAKLKEAAQDAAWFVTGIGNGIAAKFAGVDAVKAAEFVEKKKSARSKQKPDVIAEFQERVDSLNNLKEKMAASLGGTEAKVYIFVDELDRCRPDYAVTYLETIKHVFDVPGIVFLLAIDLPHLTSSAKMLFGEQLNFDDYFRKFVHRTFRLPVPSEQAIRSLTESYVLKYLVLSGRRSMLVQTDDYFRRRLVDLSLGFSMKPRQIQESFRILGHTLQTLDKEREGRLLWAIGSSAVLLSFMRVGKPDLFFEIENGWAGISKISHFLMEKLGPKNGEWWVKLILSGSLGHDTKLEDLDPILLSLKMVNPDESPARQFVQDFGGGFGHLDNRIQQVASMIEAAKGFG